MKVEIEIFAGPQRFIPTKSDVQKNIDAIERAIKGTPIVKDSILLNDTISILEGIKNKLPN